ncbi:hypothetical protein GVX82_03715 [Patescibacteria group bacterium]|jgi:hypothetical protein|nr:hypothetical protein [Patescibacteria group bacterium]
MDSTPAQPTSQVSPARNKRRWALRLLLIALVLCIGPPLLWGAVNVFDQMSCAPTFETISPGIAPLGAELGIESEQAREPAGERALCGIVDVVNVVIPFLMMLAFLLAPLLLIASFILFVLSFDKKEPQRHTPPDASGV